MKINKINFALLLLLLVGLSVFLTSAVIKKQQTAYITYDENITGPTYYSVKVPAYIDFAGEQVPIQTMDVKERFERELLSVSYWHSNTFLMLKRKTRWFPLIERILAEEGVPDDFKYLCVAESGLDNVTSPAGAKGFWQFMTGTAEEYGLEVNGEVDERFHVEKSTRAACKYLKWAKNKFGSWTTAAASYNMGVAGLDRQMERQGEPNYYDLLLNSETSRYIFRILSFKEILSKPQNYGFIIDSQDQYQPYQYREVMVDYSVSDFAAFAKKHGTNYKSLKILNPWLRDNMLTVKHNTYLVKIPL